MIHRCVCIVRVVVSFLSLSYIVFHSLSLSSFIYCNTLFLFSYIATWIFNVRSSFLQFLHRESVSNSLSKRFLVRCGYFTFSFSEKITTHFYIIRFFDLLCISRFTVCCLLLNITSLWQHNNQKYCVLYCGSNR